MKKKIVIGEKLTKKGVMKSYSSLVFVCLVAVGGYAGLVSPYLHLKGYINVLIMCLIFIMIMLFLTPIIGSSENIEFNENEVLYFHKKGYFNQFNEVIRVIFGKKEVPELILKTHDIAMLHLSYVPFLMAWAQRGYQLKMTFLMNDGTTVTLFPSSMNQMEKGDYEAAFKILESKGVQIKDKHHLRKALSMTNQDYYNYIHKIEEGNKK